MEKNLPAKPVSKNEILLDTIWNGKSLNDERHMQKIRSLFLNNLAMMEDQQISIQNRMKDCKSHLERITTIQEYFRWIPIPPEYFQKFEKNAQLSTEFRERGNREYKQEHYVSAIRGYNLALMFGVPNHEETGLAYVNRAAILIHMGQEPQQALKDLELAEESNLPLSLKSKLVERRKKCQLMIDKMKRKGLDDDEISKKKLLRDNYKKQFFHLDEASGTVIGAHAAVHIHNSEHFGRRIIVDRDTEAGSVVLIEKPFVAVLEKELRWDSEHCQFCLTRILYGIPCEHCTFAMYCNEECREKGQRFHKYEHKAWAYLHSIQCSRRDLIALRIVEILGSSEVYNLYKQSVNNDYGNSDGEKKTNGSSSPILISDLTTAVPKVIPGFSPEGVYDSSTYRPVYNLVSHMDAEELYESVSNSFKALLLTHLLQDTTSFFDEVLLDKSPIMKMEDVRSKLFSFTASLILRHLQSMPYNVISISELKKKANERSVMNNSPGHLLSSTCFGDTRQLTTALESGDNSIIQSVGYATALFSLIAMSNHTCNPNAVHVTIQGHRSALVTLKNLKANDEINITYGPLFTVHDLESRQKLLREKYNFICQCEACVQDYPTNLDSRAEDNFVKKNIKNLKELDKFKKELEQVQNLIFSGHHGEAMDRVKPCINYFGANFPPSFSLHKVAQQLFKRVLLIIAND